MSTTFNIADETRIKELIDRLEKNANAVQAALSKQTQLQEQNRHLENNLRRSEEERARIAAENIGMRTALDELKRRSSGSSLTKSPAFWQMPAATPKPEPLQAPLHSKRFQPA